MIAGIGGYGAVSAAKYHERADYHLQQARELTRALQEVGALPDLQERLAAVRERHHRVHPRLYRVRLHQLWTGLNAAVAMFGIALLIVILVR